MPTIVGEIVASDLTDKDVDDASHVGPMLDQLSLAPTSFIGDGAYDRGAVSELLARRNPDMSVLVPPCKGCRARIGRDVVADPTRSAHFGN